MGSRCVGFARSALTVAIASGAVSVVFLHGGGRSGRAAWPVQAAAISDGCVFMERSGDRDDPQTDASRVLSALGPCADLVAHSYGALAAILAAARSSAQVRTLMLCEPVCMSVARGSARVEEHVTALAPVFALANAPAVSDQEFGRCFLEALGGPAAAGTLEALGALGRRLRATPPPWEVPVPATIASVVPTLVVTAGRDTMYDEIAQALKAHGAEHLVVSGFGHRPQDDPGAMLWMQSFWQSRGRR